MNWDGIGVFADQTALSEAGAVGSEWTGASVGSWIWHPR
jgi:hypothetical protein